MKALKYALAAVLFVLLVACGGGGGGEWQKIFDCRSDVWFAIGNTLHQQMPTKTKEDYYP